MCVCRVQWSIDLADTEFEYDALKNWKPMEPGGHAILNLCAPVNDACGIDSVLPVISSSADHSCWPEYCRSNQSGC